MSTALTLERMRQDIAAMLHEDPQDILDDDNLIDLGLDSMRVMTLATRWREAGAPIEFSENGLGRHSGPMVVADRACPTKRPLIFLLQHAYV